jgi:carbonic anhydrase/acetyltransferase-like protein (isoleucine patch superfamily)
MLIEHQGKRPSIDPTAYVAPTAVICGDVDAGHKLLETHAAPAVAFMVDFIRRTRLARGTARE